MASHFWFKVSRRTHSLYEVSKPTEKQRSETILLSKLFRWVHQVSFCRSLEEHIPSSPTKQMPLMFLTTQTSSESKGNTSPFCFGWPTTRDFLCSNPPGMIPSTAGYASPSVRLCRTSPSTALQSSPVLVLFAKYCVLSLQPPREVDGDFSFRLRQ